MKLVLLLLLLSFATPVHAQKTALLLNQSDGRGEGGVSVWWVGDTAQFSDLDNMLLQALLKSGVEVVRPTDLTRISKIVRQPRLTQSNALNFSRLLGAEVAIVGEVKEVWMPSLTMLPLLGYRIDIRAEILQFEQGNIRVQTFETSSFSYHEVGNIAREQSLLRLASEVKRALSEKDSAPVAEVGFPPDSGAQVLLLNVPSGRVLERIIEDFRGLPVVENVQIFWSSVGMISLKLTGKGGQLSLTEVDNLTRTLMNTPHEFYSLTMSTNPRLPDTVELLVTESN